MKILHVITRMVHGGAQLNTLMCALEQARRGHEVTLVTGTETGSEGSLLERARGQNFRLIEMPALVRNLNPRLDWQAFRELYRLLGEGFDVVHTHTSKAGILGRWAARLRRMPVIVHTPHGHVFHGYFSTYKEKIFAIAERCTSWTCQRQIMLTQGDLRDHVAEKIGPPDHFVVIPSGVELSAFSPAKRSPAEFGLPTDKVLLGTVLRLVPVKGIFDLVAAFAEVQRSFPGCHLVFAGDGPLRVALAERIAELGLQDCVTMLGHVDPVAPFLQALDVFVLPSHNEGMGRVVVEAMASGLPIVATRIGGLPDLVEEGVNGHLAAPKQPQELAQALLKLLPHRELCQQMGQASLRRAPEFSAQVMYDRLEELYAELSLSRKRR